MSTLLTASILLFLLWPGYALLLRYSDRYALNRFLMVCGMIAVCALPFVSLESPAPVITRSLQGTIEYVEQTTYGAPPDGIVNGNERVNGEFQDNPGPAESLIGDVPTTSLVYFGGAGLMLSLLIGRLFFLFALHLRSRPQEAAGYRLLHGGAANGQAFTFGTTVYLSKDVSEDQDFEHILNHERVHARQLHTADIMLTELFLCVFWFHPAAWWLRTQTRANLEYLVDKSVVSQGADRRNYQMALVRQSAVSQGLALALPFSEPSLRSRISRMTGLPEYRVIGALAAVALIFWLGVAMMVVNGNSDRPSANFDVPGTVTFESPDLGEILAEHTQAEASGISSFALYLRRLPTPSEYAQIQQMLGVLDHTSLQIYHPCGEEEGAFALQLSHWLNVEAKLPFTLQEGELLDFHYVLKLEPNGALNQVPKQPQVSAGYFTPVVRETVWDTDNRGTRIYYVDKDTNVDELTEVQDIDNLPRKKLALQDYRDELAHEEIAVFVNGERMFLQQPAPVKVSRQGDDADPDQTDIWVNGRPVPTWSTSSFASWKEAEAENGPPPLPDNERLVCLLGMGGNRSGMIRQVRNGHTGSSRSWFEGIRLPAGREIRYYHNDNPSTAEAVLDREFAYVDVQVGYDRNDPNGLIIVQVIDDMRTNSISALSSAVKR